MSLNKLYTKDTIFFGLSRMLEMLGYYSILTIIMSYKYSEQIGLETEEIFSIFSLSMTLGVFTGILGGAIGDFVLGNKNGLITGGILQAIAALILCIPNKYGFYIGFFVNILGIGFYTNNFFSLYGKMFLNRVKYLDSAFLFLVLLVNIAGFSGPLIGNYITEHYHYRYGFILAGILFIIAVIYPYLAKFKFYNSNIYKKYKLNYKILYLGIVVFSVVVFWSITEIAYSDLNELNIKFDLFSSFKAVRKSLFSKVIFLMQLPVIIVLMIIWTYKYISNEKKLLIGYLLGIISFLMFIILKNDVQSHGFIFYILAIFLLATAETFIEPVLFSTITKYVNPKYLATANSLVKIPMRLMSALFLYSRFLNKNSLLFSLPILILTLLLLLGFIVYLKKLVKISE